MMHKVNKLAVFISFYYVEEKLKYLEEATKELHKLSETTQIFLITNAINYIEISKINKTLSKSSSFFVVDSRPNLGHPYLLTWSHFDWVKKCLNDNYDYFLYIEDDLHFTMNNFEYWLDGYELLKPYGFYPSFIRVEKRDTDNEIIATDYIEPLRYSSLSRLEFNDINYSFLSSPYPYQGMYLYDFNLMSEFITSYAYSPDFEPKNASPYPIREKANLGITFVNIPEGYVSRNLVGYQMDSGQIDPRAFVHHLPNNYANLVSDTKIGACVPISQLVEVS